MLGHEGGVPLSELPLFKEVKEILVQQRQQQQQQLAPHKGHPRDQTHRAGKNGAKRSSSRRQLIAPLSAYNASEESPYMPGGRFDEMTMRMEQEERRLKSIRNMGCSFIRPIGVGQTLQVLRATREGGAIAASQEVPPQPPAPAPPQQQRQQQEPNFILPPALQENGDASTHGSAMMDGGTPPAGHALLAAAPFGQAAEVGEDDEDDEDEDEISYDYEAEFARVEDDEDELLEKQHDARLKMPRDAATREFTIQQFVETSHMESHPYDLEDEYENPQLDAETNQGDSGEFTQIPWANISDTVQNVDSPRVSSLNSILGRRMASTSTVNQGRALPARRRLSDNNSSDHELV